MWQKKFNLFNKLILIFYKFKFILHNRKFFKNADNNQNGVILVEIHNFYPTIIPFSYFSQSLANLHKSKIVGYFPKRAIDFKAKIKKSILTFLPLTRVSIFNSFGMKKIIDVNKYLKIVDKFLIENSCNFIIKNISKKKIINLKIQGIYIGDLLYDDYLRKKYVATIDIKNNDFLFFLFNFIKTFYAWHQYFLIEKVKAVIISHNTYEHGIPLRLAQKMNIPVYMPDVGRSFYFNYKKNSSLDDVMSDEIFNSLSKKEIRNFINFSQIKIQKKFRSKMSSFVEYSKKFIKTIDIKETKYLKKNNFFPKDKIKILVACHCFYDSPHIFGKFFFNDFLDWLNELGRISEKTNYQWYLKKHPHSVNHTLANAVLKNFVKKHKKFHIISEKEDNRYLSKKVDFVLTVHGSVAYEYAYLNKPVILASAPSYLKNYKFCIKPKNKKHYIDTLMKLPKLKFNNINKKEIYFFYFVYNLCLENFGNLEKFRNKLGIFYFSPMIYKYWTNTLDYPKHLHLLDRVKTFLLSKKSLMWDKSLIN
jgi:hypothetical protein